MRSCFRKALGNAPAFPAGFLLPEHISAPAKLLAPVGDGYSSDFCFLSRRRANARQGEKGKKRRRNTPTGVFALINGWSCFRSIGRCWHTLHGNFTPCGSHRLPPLPATAHIVEMDCTGSFPPAAKTHSLRHSSSSHKINDFVGALHDASTLGLRLDNRISPICGSSPQTSHGLFVRGRLLPLYLLS